MPGNLLSILSFCYPFAYNKQKMHCLKTHSQAVFGKYFARLEVRHSTNKIKKKR